MSDSAPRDGESDDIDRLVEAYLDGALSAGEMARLDALVADAPDVAGRLARAVLVHDRLVDLFRSDGPAAAAPARTTDRRSRRWWRRIGIVSGLALAVGIGSLLLLRPAPASASAALERIVRAAAAGDRQYSIRVVDHGPNGDPGPVASEAGGRKPGVDGARLFVRGAERFVFIRSFADGTDFINGSDGSIGWSVPPTGHVHLSHDTRRFRRGMPGERDDIPFVVLAEGLSTLRERYALRHLTAPVRGGLERLEAVRSDPRHPGPERVEIDFDAQGTPQRIALSGLSAAGDGPDGVELDLVDPSDLGSDFFDHARHHDANRPIDWE
jgi:hypothetical protein